MRPLSLFAPPRKPATGVNVKVPLVLSVIEPLLRTVAVWPGWYSLPEMTNFVMVSVSPSTSLSFVKTLLFNVIPAPIVKLSTAVSGWSLTAVTEMARVAVEVRPPLSFKV